MAFGWMPQRKVLLSQPPTTTRHLCEDRDIRQREGEREDRVERKTIGEGRRHRVKIYRGKEIADVRNCTRQTHKAKEKESKKTKVTKATEMSSLRA